MKSILFLSIIICISSCTGRKTTVTSDTNDTLVTETADTVHINESKTGNKHTLWIGLFAQWQRGANGSIDGNYDTSNRIFIACGDKTGQTVDRNEIALLSGSACDGEPANRIRLMIKKENSSQFAQLSSSVQITDTSKENSKGTYHINNVEKTVTFDKTSISRIKKNPEILKIYYQKK